jgi:hypothetical protein
VDEKYIQVRLPRPVEDQLRVVGRRLRRRGLVRDSTLGEPSLGDIILVLLLRDSDHLSRSRRSASRRKKKRQDQLDLQG